MKVLLFANIGTDSDSFYHVGDESMFLETYSWYKKHFHAKDCQVSAFTNLPNHQNLDIEEIINPIPSYNISIKYFTRLLILNFFLRIFKINLLSKQENKLTQSIKEQDLIHFCGGGNINSLFPSWLYFSFIIIVIAKIYRKKIILTSQTIGPFKKSHLFLVFFILNLPSLIALRGKNTNLKKYLIFKPHIKPMLDAAYYLPKQPSPIYKQGKQKELKIGLSLHDWPTHSNTIKEILKILLKQLPPHARVSLIPHILSRHSHWDLDFMQEIIPLKLKIKDINYQKIIKNKKSAQIIKYITAQQDLLITTRYHGLVFALSENVPVISIVSDDYYSQKNTEALKLIYGNKKYKKYLFQIKDNSNYKLLPTKIKNLIRQNKKEKKILQQLNKKIKKNYDLFFNNNQKEIINSAFFAKFIQ